MDMQRSGGLRNWSVVGLVLWTALAFACSKQESSKASREDCNQVAEHIADLIIADASANTDQFWDSVTGSPGDTGIPPEVTKETFKAWLATDPGKTWMLQRRGQTLAGTQKGVDKCVESATKTTIKCLLAAKSKADVQACDKAGK